ncbi:MAG: hypothetical protein R3C05_11610 [Pirellulaceae bacterium]
MLSVSNRFCLWGYAILAVAIVAPNHLVMAEPPTPLPNAAVSEAPQLVLNSPREGIATRSEVAAKRQAPELPLSLRGEGETLPLAPAGSAFLPSISVQTSGCSMRPILDCMGPDYRDCSPRLYYRTNPSDDDPVLSLYPRITDPKTNHWYDHALRMVLRKKRITEVLR